MLLKSLGALCIIVSSSLGAGVSYDASTNLLPADPPFTRYDAAHPLGGVVLGFNATNTVTGGVFNMGPTDQGKYTFWYTDDLNLDSTQTIEVSARMRVISQSSANPNDRAGLGLALTNDLNFYNEIYVNANEVFLNKLGGTTRVRDVAFALDGTAFHDYTMRIQGNSITVLVDGIERLTGSMIDTSLLTGVPTFANWASIGDITSSAFGTWEMTSFSVNVLPEPVCAALIPLATFTLRRKR